MEPLTPLAAYDLLRFTEGFVPKLAEAVQRLESHPELALEHGWLAAAAGRLEAEASAIPGVLEAARGLGELEPVRADFAEALQGAWVDAVERLHAGITYHAGGRSPLLEALFPHARFAALRKASFGAASSYAADLERRLKSGYVTRMMAEPELSFAAPVLARVQAAHGELAACLSASPPPPEAAGDARAALLALAERLDRLVQQARLVAQAALLPLPGDFDASGLSARPKRRSPSSKTPADGPAEAARPDEPAAAPPPPAAKQARATRARP